MSGVLNLARHTLVHRVMSKNRLGRAAPKPHFAVVINTVHSPGEMSLVGHSRRSGRALPMSGLPPDSRHVNEPRFSSVWATSGLMHRNKGFNDLVGTRDRPGDQRLP